MRALVITLLFSGAAQARDAQHIFDEGNKFFMTKRYDKARANYEKALCMGYKDASVYYNLASAYSFLGKPGKAIANLHRAQKLEPWSKDIRKNLKTLTVLVYKDMRGLQNIQPKPALLKSVVRSFNLLNKDETAIAIVAFYSLFFVCLLARKFISSRFVRITVGVTGVSACIVAMLLIFIFTGSFYFDHFYPQAVITRATQLRTAPGEPQNDENSFNLKEGMVVEITSADDGWRKVALEIGDKSGWVKADTLERIF